jgi:hypothetical protein
MATAAAGALRAAVLQRFTLFRPMPHLRQQRRPWPRATRRRFPRTTSGRAPATIASRNITWRAPTSRGARPCPELVQGGRLARQLSCGRCRGAALSARRGAQRRSNLKMTARRSRSPRLRGAAPLTKEAGRGDEENQGRQKPVITMLPLVRSIFNFNYTHHKTTDTDTKRPQAAVLQPRASCHGRIWDCTLAVQPEAQFGREVAGQPLENGATVNITGHCLTPGFGPSLAHNPSDFRLGIAVACRRQPAGARATLRQLARRTTSEPSAPSGNFAP